MILPLFFLLIFFSQKRETKERKRTDWQGDRVKSEETEFAMSNYKCTVGFVLPEKREKWKTTRKWEGNFCLNIEPWLVAFWWIIKSIFRIYIVQNCIVIIRLIPLPLSALRPVVVCSSSFVVIDRGRTVGPARYFVAVLRVIYVLWVSRQMIGIGW